MVTFTHSTVNTLLEHPEILNERQRGAIEYLKTHQEISTSEYGRIYDCTVRTARRDMSHLAELKLLL